MNGIFCVYKPSGIRSTQVVAKVKKLLLENGLSKKQAKVGHGGTLDPLAEGCLVIGVGAQGCKMLSSQLSCEKQYIAQGEFGKETDSYDIDGKVVAEMAIDHITEEMVVETLRQHFTGEITQRPPAYSAIRVNGKRMYDYMRNPKEGEQVPEVPLRTVAVHKIKLLEFNPPFFRLEIDCSGGTYIRSIIHNLGNQVGSVACMTQLVRSRQGVFSSHNTVSYEQLSDYRLLQTFVDNCKDSKPK